MKTYLVTGGAGFIGCNFIKYMFTKYNNKIKIINLDKLTYAGNLANLKDVETRENYIFVKGDICDSKETPLNAHSPYSASKAAADMIVKAYYDTYSLPINITRCSNNYGLINFPKN